MPKNGPSTQESIAPIDSPETPSRQEILGGMVSVVMATDPILPEERKEISDGRAATIAVDYVEPALRDLRSQDMNRASAIPKLEKALTQLREEVR